MVRTVLVHTMIASNLVPVGDEACKKIVTFWREEEFAEMAISKRGP
jgi:hypothetical protein